MLFETSMSAIDFGFVVNSCPLSEEETTKAATRMKCGLDKNGRSRYVCVPNEYLTALIEFCYTKTIVAFYEIGNCLKAVGDGFLDHVSCKNFTEGCPTESYRSTELYKYPACQYLNRKKGCFAADSSCSDSENGSMDALSTPLSGILNISTDYANYTETTDRVGDVEDGYIGTIIGVVSSLLIIIGILIIFLIRKRVHSRRRENISTMTTRSTEHKSEEEKHNMESPSGSVSFSNLEEEERNIPGSNEKLPLLTTVPDTYQEAQIQAQEAKFAEPSLEQSASSKSIEILEKTSKCQKSPAAVQKQTRRDVQRYTSKEKEGEILTVEAMEKSTQPTLSKTPASNVGECPLEKPTKTGPVFQRQFIMKGLTKSKEDIQKGIISMFDNIMKIIESKEYDTNLRQCLEKASPDYATFIAKRKKDILKSDHGIVVAGETSAGKSTLINKILEMRIFKGRNMESTSTICKIRNSDKVVIKAELESGKVESMDDIMDIDVLTKEGEKTLRNTLKKLTDMTIEKSSKKFKSVDIGLPVPFLKGNTIMVDTPGIGGSGKVSQKLMEYLPNAVSFIFVINVASAGGMQRDRLPEILHSITNLQMDDEMPCFDPRSVIFVTNKWDSIKNDSDDSSDEDEVEKTWEKISKRILRHWPTVREENIFRMNLADVYKEDKLNATEEFNQFRKSLERMIQENENIRITEHFRYLYKLLEDMCTGVRTRQELVKKSKDEQEKKSKEHQMQIDLLREKCKTKSHDWRSRIKCFIEQQAKDSLDYMSSDNGKERILNQKDKLPIMEEWYIPTTIGDDVQERIDDYINEKVRSSDVIEEFRNIKDEILEFYKEISSEIEKIESEWTGTIDESNTLKDISCKEESVAPYVAGVIATAPIWFPLLAAGVAIAVAAVPIAAPIISYLGRDKRKKKLIDKEYEKCKSSFRAKMCNAMESNHGDKLNKLISKVTDVYLKRRINFIEGTIAELSQNRENIIANQNTLKSLAEKIKTLKDEAEEINQALNICATE